MVRFSLLVDVRATTVISPGDLVNVILFSFPSDISTVVINSSNRNYLIVNPDHLIAITTLASSFHCLRRSILSFYFSSSNDNVYAVLGKLRHALFEVQPKKSVDSSFLTLFYNRSRSPPQQSGSQTYFMNCITKF